MNLIGQLPDYKVVKAVPVIVLDGDVPKEPRNSKKKKPINQISRI